MIHRDVEKSLDLGRVKIHGKDPVGAGGGDEIRHQLGGNRIPRLGLAILARIAHVGDHGRDAGGGGALESVDHDEQLHQMIVDRLAGGLHHEYVRPTHGFVDGNRNFTVAEGRDLRLSQGKPQRLGDLPGQLAVGVR